MGCAEYTSLISSIRLDFLDIFGRGYVIEHCIAALTEKRERKQLEAYKTDMLRSIYLNMYAYFSGGKNIPEVTRWVDIAEKNQKPEKEETRTADDIIGSINNKLKKLGGGKS